MLKPHIVKTFFVALIVGSLSYAASFAFLDNTASAATPALENGLADPYPAPEISGIDSWINSPPLQISELKGKVVLIDFWTYSCINCMRTIPYIKELYNKYHDKGLVIIGVHTPEFDFEKDLSNVQNAVTNDGIKYPVALDSHFATWQNFKNSYWPAHYLIDKNGNVVYTHFGEGDYDVTENNIRILLGLKGAASSVDLGDNNASGPVSPETYFGYARAANYAGKQAVTNDKQSSYTFPAKLTGNAWALQGDWTVMPDKIISEKNNAALKFHFTANKVYIVMGSATGKTIPVKLLYNGENISEEKGKDVTSSSVMVGKHSLFEVLSFTNSTDGILQIIASQPGLEVYTFTFG
jgi:thiol-disulfide isomerase/thioredoxin